MTVALAMDPDGYPKPRVMVQEPPKKKRRFRLWHLMVLIAVVAFVYKDIELMSSSFGVGPVGGESYYSEYRTVFYRNHQLFTFSKEEFKMYTRYRLEFTTE